MIFRIERLIEINRSFVNSLKPSILYIALMLSINPIHPSIIYLPPVLSINPSIIKIINICSVYHFFII